MSDDAKAQDLDSSPKAEPLDVTAQPADTPAPEKAESSPAQGDTEATPLSIVRDVVKERDAPAAASPAEGTEEGDEPAAAESHKEPDNESYSDVPFNKHPRFKQLLNERNTFKVDAERYQNVVGFLRNNNLDDAEAADVLSIAGLAKTHPRQAFEQMRPWLQRVLEAAGEVIPPDLAQRVQAGELTQAAALEVSRARADIAYGEVREKYVVQRQETQQQEAARTAVRMAVDVWESERRRRDPNFDAKYEAIQKEVAWRFSRGERPSTPDAVREQLNDVYKVVNAAHAPPKPAPAPTANRRPIASATPGAAASTVAQPKNTLDIIRANRRGAA